jgi:hypothetical protein
VPTGIEEAIVVRGLMVQPRHQISAPKRMTIAEIHSHAMKTIPHIWAGMDANEKALGNFAIHADRICFPDDG